MTTTAPDSTVRVVLSGGLDSTAALAAIMNQSEPERVSSISFSYGQRHARELVAAERVADYYQIEHELIDLRSVTLASPAHSALTGSGKIPEGHYAADTMASTVVQGRNLLFASAAIARSQPGDSLVFGVHAGDHPIYPDCRPGFWDQLRILASAAYGITVVTPFLHVSKAAVVSRGAQDRAPFQLTWSCYNGGDRHCGRCGTCVERAEAFSLASVPDPTDYQDPEFWHQALLEGQDAR